MRLINTHTLKLEEFQGPVIPKYAILSHRWENEEVSFDDWISDRREKMAGYMKISGLCAYAAAETWDYVWIDTCCIDKKSSAELSESINSMFNWYKDAAICYAYLSDVEDELEPPQQFDSAFRQSKWFTRGWTLQELLAPDEIIFLSRDWKEIGSKCSLNMLICQITRIGDLDKYMTASVATKFSWMSKRVTTRQEDEAYCLFGLFNINMPLIYGEGTNAFQRLQREILARTNDESIFAWDYPEDVTRGELLFAPAPEYFSRSGNIATSHKSMGTRQPMSMTNIGLQIDLFVIKNGDYFETPLNCRRKRSSRPLGLRLEKRKDGRYRRLDLLEDFTLSAKAKKENAILEDIRYYHYRPSSNFRIQVLCHEAFKEQQIVFLESECVDFDQRYKVAEDGHKIHLFYDTPVSSFPPYDTVGSTIIGYCRCVAFLLRVDDDTEVGIFFGNGPSGIWVDIVPKIYHSKGKFWWREYEIRTSGHFDRISRLIRPGLSITAVLRKRNIMAKVHTPNGPTDYELFLDVGNDQLRWPELRY